MSDLVKDWNATLGERKESIQAWNSELSAKYKRGEIGCEALATGLQVEPEQVPKPTPKWASSWRKRWGWSMLTRGSNDSTWLPWDRPDMMAARKALSDQIQEESIHPGLILNYDQVWRACWSTSKYKLAYKDRSQMGKQPTRRKHGPRLDKKVHAIKGSRRSMTVSCINGLEVMHAG